MSEEMPWRAPKNAILQNTDREARIAMAREALEQSNWCVSAAARAIGMDPGNFRRLLRSIQMPGYPTGKKN